MSRRVSRLEQMFVWPVGGRGVQNRGTSPGWVHSRIGPGPRHGWGDRTKQAGQSDSPSADPIRVRRGTRCYPHTMVDTLEQAHRLIRIVADDPGLPRHVRRRARGLGQLAASEPRLVWERLGRLRESVIPGLPVEIPAVDYARCVPIPVFWRYHLRPARQAFFDTAEDYRRYLEASVDPAAAAMQDLIGGILIPAKNSWLIPATHIAGLDGVGIRSRLLIDDDPPYLVMMLPADRMGVTGVRVREPRGVDAIPGRLLRWSPGGVPDERIDQDIPADALGGLEWRP